MVTFCSNEKETIKPVIDTRQGTSHVGSIKNMLPINHDIQQTGKDNPRWWLTFPLTMEPEIHGKTKAFDWIKIYPRVIQWSDGKYYSFRGTHSAMPEYGIKGDNTVFYREILIENGERV